MNQHTPSQKSVSLVHFAFMTAESLESVIHGLGLKMGIHAMRFFQEHYRDLRRDPTVGELQLFDELITHRNLSHTTICLTEMKTESAAIAETLSDMMACRRAVYSDLDRPSTLAELAELAERYLSATTERTNPLKNTLIRFGAHRDLLLATEGADRTASTGNGTDEISIGCKTHETSFRGGAISEGDYVYAILQNTVDSEDFEARLCLLLSSPNARKCIKTARALTQTSLLEALISVADGLSVNVTPHWDPATFSPRMLSNPTFGVLMVAAPERSADLLLEAQAMDLRVERIAKVTKGTEIRIQDDINGTHAVSTPFLRSLVIRQYQSASVNIPKTPNISLSLDRIGTCTLNKQKHAVIKTSATGDSPFHAALHSVLYALSHFVAIGAEPSALGLACHLTLPAKLTSQDTFGNALALILGLYRMQAEFELFGNAPAIDLQACDMPSVSTAILAPIPTKTTETFVCGYGSKVFYLEPRFDENGVPDFADLKKMHNYIRALMRDKHILSIRPTGDDLQDDLRRMEKNIPLQLVRKDPLASRIGGFLVEADTNIQGVLVATTAPHPEPTDDDGKNASIPAAKTQA